MTTERTYIILRPTLKYVLAMIYVVIQILNSNCPFLKCNIVKIAREKCKVAVD